MKMATMSISIPDPMKDWVQFQVETGTYANSSDYVRDLIRQDQKKTKQNTNVARSDHHRLTKRRK
jgi:antitoxin ParD1/3/4